MVVMMMVMIMLVVMVVVMLVIVVMMVFMVMVMVMFMIVIMVMVMLMMVVAELFLSVHSHPQMRPADPALDGGFCLHMYAGDPQRIDLLNKSRTFSLRQELQQSRAQHVACGTHW